LGTAASIRPAFDRAAASNCPSSIIVPPKGSFTVALRQRQWCGGGIHQ
jgi:hypothetical protein